LADRELDISVGRKGRIRSWISLLADRELDISVGR
jgi:hypothetical protein